MIVSEPSNPWVTGIEQLYSREFLAEARDRLTPGGVYCQWFHFYEMNDEVIALALKTYTSVFDHVAVWSTNHADLMLLGFRDPTIRDRRRAPRARACSAPISAASRGGSASQTWRRCSRTRRFRSASSMRSSSRPDPFPLPPAAELRGGAGVLRRARGDAAVHGLWRAAEIGAANSLLRPPSRRPRRASGARRRARGGLVCLRERAAGLRRARCGLGERRTGSSEAEFRARREHRESSAVRSSCRRLRALRNGAPADGSIADPPRRGDGDDAPVHGAVRAQCAAPGRGAAEDLEALRSSTSWASSAARPGCARAEGLMIGDPPPVPEDWLKPRREAIAAAHHAPPLEGGGRGRRRRRRGGSDPRGELADRVVGRLRQERGERSRERLA